MTRLPLPSNVSRRDLLRFSLAGAGIVALGPFGRFLSEARGAPLALKRMVIVNMFGGADTLNMFIPVQLGQYYQRRQLFTGGTLVADISIPAAQAQSLNAGPAATTQYMLHPAMPKLAALWAAGNVAAVNKVGYPRANLSHFESEDIFSYGVRDGFNGLPVPISGWIARYADRNAPTPLGAVGLGVGRRRDFIGGSTNPLLVNSLSSFRISGSTAGSSNARLHRTQAAKDMLARFYGSGLPGETKAALDQAYQVTGQVQTAISGFSTTVTFPNTGIAQRLRDVAILIQGGFETRIFYTGFGGHDTHGSQGQATGSQANLMRAMDDAIGAFADDMKARNLWNDVAIVVITEFGRRNYVNGSAGTDHGHGFCALVVGGAVQGGVYGPDLTENDLSGEYLSYSVDFRSIYKEVLSRFMGADPEPIFPEALAINTALPLI